MCCFLHHRLHSTKNMDLYSPTDCTLAPLKNSSRFGSTGTVLYVIIFLNFHAKSFYVAKFHRPIRAISLSLSFHHSETGNGCLCHPHSHPSSLNELLLSGWGLNASLPTIMAMSAKIGTRQLRCRSAPVSSSSRNVARNTPQDRI